MIDILSRQLAIKANTAANTAATQATNAANSVTAVGTSVQCTCAMAQSASMAATSTTLFTTGYATFGDGGHGLYRRVATQPSHLGRFRSSDRYLPNGTTDATNGGWWELVPDAAEINVLQFGADKTGTSASDAAFQAAFGMLTAYRGTWAYGDPLSNIVIRVPAGKFLLTSSESIIPSSYTTKTTGFFMKGTDLYQSNIIFAPASGSNVLIYNQAFLFCMIEGITFIGTSLAQTFYRADMTGNSQQGWTFRRCAWNGTWGKGFYLTGNNNNSEYTWEDCRGVGRMFQFLYTPSTSATPAGSDQFLNYRFRECHLWYGDMPGGVAGTFTGSIASNVLTVTSVASGTLAAGQTIATPSASANQFVNRIAGQYDRVVILSQLTGTTGGAGTYQVLNCTGTVASTTLANLVNDANSIIDMESGGHVHTWGCDFSGMQSGVAFQLRGTSHAQGVCTFSSMSCRYEMKSPNVATLYSEWPQGLISFDKNDWSSQANAYYNADGSLPNAFYINNVNTASAHYVFRDSQLIGAMALTHGTNDFEMVKLITLEQCDHMQIADPYQMFNFVSSTNDRGAPTVFLNTVRGMANRVSAAPSWAASTAYALGAIRAGNSGNSLYKCTTAGTSGAASAAITGSISGTTLTVSATASGTISVGQKIVGAKNASVTANTASSTTVTVTAVGSGQLAVGQAISGAGIPAGATITAFGSFNGSTGTVTISAAATATATGVTLTTTGVSVLEDTIITAGSGTSWTVNRSQTVQSQALALTGGPQSAAASIPDGTAAWAFVSNNSRDYFNDGNAISPYAAPQRLQSKRRVAEFGGQMFTNVSGSYGTNELIIPPNAIIVGAYCYAPAGAVSSGYPADYLIECDDGTTILKVLPGVACSAGWSVSASNLFVPVGTNMQKRRLKLVAGGAGGGTIDQYNGAHRTWVEYVL